jgi:predicted phage replisome organizer
MFEAKWIKINTNMFENEKLRLIDSMPEKDTIHYIWIRLLIQAGKTNDNGYIYINKNVHFTAEMLSTIFCRSLSSIELALNTLEMYKMIKFDKRNGIKIINWDKYQNVEGMERVREQSRKRMQKLREKKKSKDTETCDVTVTQNDVTVTGQREKKIKKKNKNKEIEEESESNIVVIEEVMKEKRKAEKADDKAMKVISFYEKITGKIGILNHGSLVVAINSHGEKYVKMAIDKALEVNKINMTYVNGILRNWATEGYPEGGIVSGHRRQKSTDSEKFKGFKPKEPRKLSEEERRIAESELI